MSASLHADERRPIPTVAIVGNDAVLAAAPATPVQLAHACMRRGFTVAVPASWGDELVAAETVRRLASRDKGPAVMCVCPYVRSRLLAPGPDLAPFLVSLVSPPIAAARYLRTVYGDHGVHITYIGACPSANDASIDDRLTPDAFIADLAEHGIALSEQPLVFDSIVPPDRRRWCSLPGGVPSAEVLWSETGTRALIEIERDDVSTDLAQHIITREHVLLDLAPSLGCVCSGAIGTLPSHSARVAVTSLEPPRALSSVIDPATVVPLEEPVPGVPGVAVWATLRAPIVEPAHGTRLEVVLDEMLGAEVSRSAVESLVDLESDLDSNSAGIPSPLEVNGADLVEEPVFIEPGEREATGDELQAEDAPGAPEPAAREVARAALNDEPIVAAAVDTPVGMAPAQANGSSGETTEIVHPAIVHVPDVGRPSVRRRTPPGMASRYAPTSLPRATGADGRPLPRAYVAKRRTPATGGSIAEAAPPLPTPEPTTLRPSNVVFPTSSVAPTADSAAVIEAADDPKPTPPSESRGVAPEPAPTEAVPAQPSGTSVPPVPAEPSPIATPESSRRDRAPASDSRRHGAPATVPAGNQGALMILLVMTLLALGAFVFYTLRR